MREIHANDFAVTPRQRLLYGIGESATIWIGGACAQEPLLDCLGALAAIARQHVDVELSDHQLQARGRKIDDRGIDRADRRPVQLLMLLHADGGDRYTVRAEGPNETHDPGSLRRPFDSEVVVVQFGRWIRFVREAKCHRDVLRADDSQPR